MKINIGFVCLVFVYYTKICQFCRFFCLPAVFCQRKIAVINIILAGKKEKLKIFLKKIKKIASFFAKWLYLWYMSDEQKRIT